MSTNATRPWVLGIASSHNGAVCLLHGDEIVVAIQEERLLRMKRARHPGAKDSLAIRYCLEYAGITAADLDMVVLSASGPNGVADEDLSLNPALRVQHHRVPTAVIGHHAAHAFGAFATSGFNDAAVLVVDGYGSPWQDLPRTEQELLDLNEISRSIAGHRDTPVETISIYAAHDATVEPIEKHVGSRDLRPKSGMLPFWSLGTMYQYVSGQIFGRSLESAGKMMGLAPYGTPTTPTSDFFSTASNRFTFLDTVPNAYLHDERWPRRQDEYQNLAASAQRAIEDALFVLTVHLQKLTKARRLCYAGGVALNSVANEFLVQESGFDDVYIMPAAEDSGTAIGAAYYGLWQLTRQNSRKRLAHDAVGRCYGSAEVRRSIERCPAIQIAASSAAIEPAIDLLCEGKILGWFQGRSELGPRALGQRSIICDPRRPEMKEVLNSRVKFREGFRPFAPVIPFDQLTRWFDTPRPVESPFMLRVLPFREEVRKCVPAVVHVDGTGRVQTVTPEANGRFYELVARFFARTGCPILLNTSLNVAGEPIVETPDEALNCLLVTGLDGCVLEDWLVVKDSAYRSPLDLVPKLCVDHISIDCNVVNHGTAAEQTLTREIAHITVPTRWGPAVSHVDATVLPVIERIDGRRSGWQILRELQQQTALSRLDERKLTKLLASLRRSCIIAW